MGTFLPTGYFKWIPTLTLDGSTKTFQTVFMGKNNPVDPAATIGANMRTYFVNTGRPYAPGQMYIGYTMAAAETYVNIGGTVTYNLDETPSVGTKVGSVGTPINTSILLKKNTGIVGKRYRGRHMMPNLWCPEANISQAGILDGTAITLVAGIWDPAYASFTGGPYDPVLGHTSSEVAPTPYDTVTVQPKIGTMGHRIRGY